MAVVVGVATESGAFTVEVVGSDVDAEMAAGSPDPAEQAATTMSKEGRARLLNRISVRQFDSVAVRR